MGLQICARLAEKGWKVICVDGDLPYAASKNCSGWIQPFQFRTPSWKSFAFDILQNSNWFYGSLFSVLQKNIHPVKIWRPCTIEYQNSWMAFAANIPFPDFQVYSQNRSPFTKKNEIGLIFNSYVLNSTEFLNASKEFLKSNFEVEFISHVIDYKNINQKFIDLNSYSIEYDVLFFCEGFRGKDNPIFPEAKEFIRAEYGEWLEMDWSDDYGFYNEHYGLAFKNKIIIGSRYETIEEKMHPNKSIYESTLYKITEKKFNQKIEIFEGKRPGNILGKKPLFLNKNNMFWINGLGSRGILYSGWFSDHFFSKVVF